MTLHLVPIEKVVVIKPYRPKIVSFIPKGLPRLLDVLDWDDKNLAVTSDEDSVTKALDIILLDYYDAYI